MTAHATSFHRLFGIIQRLRAPDGCPWDREQTPASMRANLVEEAHELIEAINDGEPSHIREEIGDVYLVLTMIAYMYEQEGHFTVSDALEGISDKLIRRHPHVFGDSNAATSEEVLAQWQDIKTKVEGRAEKNSLLDQVSKALGPLDRAYAMQKKAAKVGFDWLRIEDVWAKAQEELDETREATTEADPARLEEEIGDLLFSVINIARFLKVDPAQALQRTNTKFDRRFRAVEAGMAQRGLSLGAEHFALMDQLWNEAKEKK